MALRRDPQLTREDVYERREARLAAFRKFLELALKYARAGHIGVGVDYKITGKPAEDLHDLLESALTEKDLYCMPLGHFDLGGPLEPIDHYHLHGLKDQLLDALAELPEQ